MARKEFEDDGRTIADMSDLSTPGLLGHRQADGKKDKKELFELHPGQEPFTPKERLRYTWAALKAGLLIGLAYIVGLGLIVGLLILIW